MDIQQSIPFVPFIVLFLLQLGDLAFTKHGLKENRFREVNPLIRKIPFKLTVALKLSIPFFFLLFNFEPFYIWVFNGVMALTLLWNLTVLLYFSKR